MTKYINEMLNEFPIKFSTVNKNIMPVGVNMFEEDKGKLFNEQKRELFHQTTKKALFLCKRARPDIQPIISVLCMHVMSPGTKDWFKLVRMMKFLKLIRQDKLVLNASQGIAGVEWMIGTSFVVHPNFKSHTGAVMMINSWQRSHDIKIIKNKS